MSGRTLSKEDVSGGGGDGDNDDENDSASDSIFFIFANHRAQICRMNTWLAGWLCDLDHPPASMTAILSALSVHTHSFSIYVCFSLLHSLPIVLYH